MFLPPTFSVLSFAGWLQEHKKQDTICLAARKGRSGVILQLLKGGVSATARDCSGWSPLLLACHGLGAVVDHLWNRQPASSSVHADVFDAANALEFAASQGNSECVQILLTQPTPLDVNRKIPETDWFPLLSAARYVMPAVVEVLLSLGASPSLTDSNGCTTLHMAIVGSYTPNSEDLLRCVKILCRAMARIDGAAINARNHSGRTAYEYAGMNLSAQPELLSRVQELLVRYGAVHY